MIRTLLPVIHGLTIAAILWLGLCGLADRLRRVRAGALLELALGLVAVGVLLLPFGEASLWRRIFTVHANPSLPLLGIVGASLHQRFRGRPWFSREDCRAIWWFGAVGGTLLYLHPLSGLGIDFYYWGWERTFAAWGVAGAAAVLLAVGNRLGLLLLSGLAAYAFDALESQNCWDYLIDPTYWLAGVLLVARATIRRGLVWFRPAAAG